jgi:hypothetical protein
MADFMGHSATKNYGDLEVGTFNSGETHHMFVVDTGQNREDHRGLVVNFPGAHWPD